MNFIDGFEEASRAQSELACQRTGVLVSWRPWKKTKVTEEDGDSCVTRVTRVPGGSKVI